MKLWYMLGVTAITQQLRIYGEDEDMVLYEGSNDASPKALDDAEVKEVWTEDDALVIWTDFFEDNSGRE